jgi:hypothetical protein
MRTRGQLVVEKIWGAGNAAVMNALMGGSLEITRSAGSRSLLDFLDTWVAGGLGPSGLPQAPQSPCEFVSVGHVWTPIGSSACSVCSFLFFFTSINIFCFQQSSRSCSIQTAGSLKSPPTGFGNFLARLLTTVILASPYEYS